MDDKNVAKPADPKGSQKVPAVVVKPAAPVAAPAAKPAGTAVVTAPVAKPAAAAAPKVPATAAKHAAEAPVDAAAIKKLGDSFAQIKKELNKTIVGQSEVITALMVALFGNGHCLLEGVPGLAKTLLISSLSQALSLSFKRIQFTPDLMPSDITGTEIIQDDPETGERKFKFLEGPIFANIILADEINRTPPKTQAAMLEAMQEKQISIGGKVHKLSKPFFVLATQNPLEQEGTYPLPEAQQDRFLFKVFVDYPDSDEEEEIMRRVANQAFEKINPVMDANGILAAQDTIRQIPVADKVYDYAKRLVRATRHNSPEAPDFIKNWLAWGAGPRASICMIQAARAHAGINGNTCVTCEDIVSVAHSVMRHRIACNYVARAEGVTSEKVIDELLNKIEKF